MLTDECVICKITELFSSRGANTVHKLCVLVCVFIQGCKKASVKRESKEKRDSEETKENQKTKSDDSGEEKNREEDLHKNNAHRKKGVHSSASAHLALCVCDSVCGGSISWYLHVQLCV